MKAASREALANSQSRVDEILAGDKNVARPVQAGLDIFEVVDVLDGDRELRVSFIDVAAPAEARKSLAENLFGSKVSAGALSILQEAAANQWSSPKDFVNGLVSLGRRALLRAAEASDMQPFTELLHAVTHPWEPHPSYEQPDPNGLAGFLTYCGT